MKNPIYRLGEVVRIDGPYVTVNVKNAKDFDFLSPGLELSVGSKVCVKYDNGFAQIDAVFNSCNPDEVSQEFTNKYLKSF